jgi:hypothetical protein
MSNSKKMAFVTIGDNKSIEMREVPATVKVGESFDDFVPLQSDATKFEKVTVKVMGFVGGDSNDSNSVNEKWESVKVYFSKWRWYHYGAAIILATWLFMLLKLMAG